MLLFYPFTRVLTTTTTITNTSVVYLNVNHKQTLFYDTHNELRKKKKIRIINHYQKKAVLSSDNLQKRRDAIFVPRYFSFLYQKPSCVCDEEAKFMLIPCSLHVASMLTVG